MDRLPNELLHHIVTYLDDSPPAIYSKLRDDPTNVLDRPADQTVNCLKAASLVSRLWRKTALPLLFRHVVWTIDRFDQPLAGHSVLLQFELFRFLRHSGLERNVLSLTIAIPYPRDFISKDEEQASTWGVFPRRKQTREDECSDVPAMAWDNNWFWQAIFQRLDPLRITLISSASILASLLRRQIDLTSSWAFGVRYQVISLSRPSRHMSASILPPFDSPPHIPSNSVSSKAPVPCDLFTIRDWTDLLVNEGSSGGIYGTYEYFHHTPPSLLKALLDAEDPSLRPFLHGTLRSMSYIAVFPLSPHITQVLIPNFPPIPRLYLQIVPREPEFFDRAHLPTSVDFSDLWMERNISYQHIFGAMLGLDDDGERLQSLTELETGDTADRESWLAAVKLVSQVWQPNARWRVEREGVFVRVSPGEETQMAT